MYTIIDALLDITPQLLQTQFQFISVVYPRLVHSLLDYSSDPVINLWAVRWPEIRWYCLLEKSHIAVCPVCWGVVVLSFPR